MISGIVIDLVIRDCRKTADEKHHHHDHEGEQGCEERLALAALRHTMEVFIYIAGISFLLNLGILEYHSKCMDGKPPEHAQGIQCRYDLRCLLPVMVDREQNQDPDSCIDYQYVEQGKGCCDHLHLQCVKCGRIYHLDCAFMKEISEHIEKDHGFELQCRNSVLYGICKDCKTMKA